MKITRWVLLAVFCIAIPAAFAADVKISALPAASSSNTTDEYPANQSGTTRKVTGAQLASLSIANIGGSSATVGIGPETWQRLVTDCSANNTVTMATCMTTNGLPAGFYNFEYHVVFLTGGTSAGIRLEVGTTGIWSRFRAMTSVVATAAASNAMLSNMGKNGFTIGGWATRASANTSNNQVLSMGGVDSVAPHQMAIVQGSFYQTSSGASLFLQVATNRPATGGVGGSITLLQDTVLILRRM